MAAAGPLAFPKKPPTAATGANARPKSSRGYHFNLCFENTTIDYYCSEKIWDSIQSLCLPIYYGHGNKIYEDFPPQSFLDYCEFRSPQALFQYVEEMSLEEFRARMNRCIAAFNAAYRKRRPTPRFYRFSDALLGRIVQKLHLVNAERPVAVSA